jgi:hypothetical protein
MIQFHQILLQFYASQVGLPNIYYETEGVYSMEMLITKENTEWYTDQDLATEH